MPYTGPFTGGYINQGTIDGIVATNTQINGKLNNAGTITANGIKLINSSILTDDYVAILEAGSNTGGISIDSTSSLKGIIWIQGSDFTGDVYNAGSMTGSFGILVYPTAFTGNIINTGSYTGSGAGGIGIYLTHTRVTGNISNSGTISSGGYDGIFILQSSLSGTISNTGSITGNIGISMGAGSAPGSGPQPPLGSAPALNIFNSGTITGTSGTAVQLVTASAGNNIFTLGPGYHVNGGVHGAGGDIFQLGGSGSDSFDLTNIGSQYTGFTTFNVVGATWTVSGSGSNWNVKSGAEMDLASGSLSATNVNGGELVIHSGALATGTTITAGGIEYVSAGGTATNVTFGDTASMLALENPAALTGLLSSWHVGNKIDFVHTAVTSASIANGGASLGIMTSDGHSYQYNLAGLQAHTKAFIQDDGAGGTFVQLQVAPGAPAIALAHDTGPLATDHVTSDPTLVVTPAQSGGTLLYKADGAASFSTTAPAFATDGSADGVHTVSVEQRDAGGIIGPASSFNFTLDTTAAHVTGLATSAAGNNTAGATVEFTLAFDEAVHVAGGTPTLTLNNGATAHYDAAATAALHDSTKLAFDYLVSSGDPTTHALAVTGLAANGATFDDIAGNHAVPSGVAKQFSGVSINDPSGIDDFMTPPHLASTGLASTADFHLL